MGVFFWGLGIGFVLTLGVLWGRGRWGRVWRRMSWRWGGRNQRIVPVYVHGKLLVIPEPTPEPTPEPVTPKEPPV